MISNFLFAISIILIAYIYLKPKSKLCKEITAKGKIGIYYASKSGNSAKLSSLLQETLYEILTDSEVINIKDFKVN